LIHFYKRQETRSPLRLEDHEIEQLVDCQSVKVTLQGGLS